MPFRPQEPVLPALEKMGPGDHYCGIFRSDEEHRRVVADFVRLGLERNERIVYLVDLQTAGQLKSTLASANIDVEQIIRSGQFVILTAKDAYLKEGAFEPEKMVNVLNDETVRALADGYSAVRLSGEMTWALAGEPGSERLIDYEAMLTAFMNTGPKCYGICQYDQRRFDADLLLDVLHTHPKVIVDQHGFDNESMYFVEPEKFLTADRSSAMLDTWLTNLAGRA